MLMFNWQEIGVFQLKFFTLGLLMVPAPVIITPIDSMQQKSLVYSNLLILGQVVQAAQGWSMLF
jgi:hypothetical protein